MVGSILTKNVSFVFGSPKANQQETTLPAYDPLQKAILPSAFFDAG